MEIIKIKRDSIRKNPDMGNTMTCVLGDTTIGFEYRGNNLPDILKDENNVLITHVESNFYHGELLNPPTADMWDELRKACDPEGGLTIFERTALRRVYHPPEPEWLFDYEDAAVTCSNCRGTTKLSEIEITRVGCDSWCGYQCPLCGDIGTFNFAYEKL